MISKTELQRWLYTTTAGNIAVDDGGLTLVECDDTGRRVGEAYLEVGGIPAEIQLPHPDNPEHVENLCTLELLEALGFEGTDVSLAECVFENGFAWRHSPELEGDNDILFVYKLPARSEHVTEVGFDRCAMKTSTDIFEEYDWVDWDSFLSTFGTDKESWAELPFPQKISDLYQYYGFDNIFGSCYWEGFKIRDPDKDYGSSPAPGESVDDYEERLMSGAPEIGEPVIANDFVRKEEGVWFASGGGQCFGCELHQWHNGMDAVYAAGSLVVANKPIPLDALQDAIDLMEQNVASKIESGDLYDAAHGQVLLGYMKVALKAEPDDEPQYAEL